jgi:thioredoxin 1
MREITDESFDDDVLAAGKPVVVDFWAPWCGPCKAIEPVLEELAATSEHTDFVRLDVDANPNTAVRFGVLTIPTVILFADGEARATVYGARPKRHFQQAFEPYLSGPSNPPIG